MARFVAVAIGVLALTVGGTAAGERPGRIAFARDAGIQFELFTVAPDGSHWSAARDSQLRGARSADADAIRSGAIVSALERGVV